MSSEMAGEISGEIKFVHLRTHTDYSIVDGLISVDKIFPAVKSLGMDACAVTDLMNFYAVIKLYKAAKSAGVKPIFGADVLIKNKDKNKDQTQEAPFLLTLLCQNNQGYQSLTELISRAYLEGERIQGIPVLEQSWLDLKSCAGLIALSGGLEGDIGRLITQGHIDQAKNNLNAWLNIFDQNRFYLELQRLGKTGEQDYINQALQLAQSENIPVLATQDARFLNPEDFEAHEVRHCVHEGVVLEDPRREKKYTPYQYLASPDYMAQLFADIPEALENTVEIAKRCSVKFKLGKAYLPDFPVPEGQTIETYLTYCAHQGLEKRLEIILKNNLKNNSKNTYQERLDLELSVIIKMGFSGYFMIVADFIQWAKDHDIPVGPGRGSGAGSLVAYSLGITDIDPLPYDLLFERFLNPERVSMPDFDVDFCMDGRDRVIEYVMDKYGALAVSQIITFGTMAAKAVIRDVGRVMAHPYGFVDSIAKLIPNDIGMTLNKALESEVLLKQRYEQEEEVKNLVDMGLKLEGTIRNVGKHAGGVVISPSKLSDFCAVYCEEGSKALVSQFDKDDVEAVGLVKFDFLGLRNLTIIHYALKNINQNNINKNNNKILDINLIPLDDLKTFELLKRCETTAVFQLESRGMKDLIRRLQPDCFEDIVALVALFRPGPLQSGMVDDFINRKHGLASTAYPHPDTESILKPTYGVILYQEQVMLIPQVLAGYTLGGADILRRAMGKKKPEEMAEQRSVFIDGAKANGIAEDISSGIFDLMEKFSGYGFNKSHSAAYALVAYQTAYLKAHYPAEFMAAVLSSDMDNTDKMVVFIEDAKQMGLKIINPSVNHSFYRFTVSESEGDSQSIIFGLGAVKGLGEAAVNLIVEEREARGNFKNLFDFCARLDHRKINKRALEALVNSGAMDQLGPSREIIFASLDCAVRWANQQVQNSQRGQDDLFSQAQNQTAQPEFVGVSIPSPIFTNPAQLLISRYLKERETLGVFLTGHPYEIYQKDLNLLKIQNLKDIKPSPKNKKELLQKVAGMITETRKIKTKRGSIMMILVLEDGVSKQEVTVFSDVLDNFSNLIKQDACVVIEAQVSHDDYSGNLRISAKNIMSLEEARIRYVKSLTLFLNHEINLEKLEQLKIILNQYQNKGAARLKIQYQNQSSEVLFEQDSGQTILLSDACLNNLENLLGCDHFKLD